MFASSRFRAGHAWLALAIVAGGLFIRLAVAPSYGYLGREGDLLEQKQATHRALTLGIHEVYTPNAVNDPAESEVIAGRCHAALQQTVADPGDAVRVLRAAGANRRHLQEDPSVGAAKVLTTGDRFAQIGLASAL